MRVGKKMRLQPGTELYRLYVGLRLGLYTSSQERMRWKNALYGVHYGTSWDTTEADAEVARRRAEARS